jgi:hypothetical protein
MFLYLCNGTFGKMLQIVKGRKFRHQCEEAKERIIGLKIGHPHITYELLPEVVDECHTCGKYHSYAPERHGS